MPKLVYLMIVQGAYKEYNSLIDQICAKYKLLGSEECGAVGTPAFNAECSKLFPSFSLHEQTMSASEPANAQETSQAPALQALKAFFRSRLQWQV